MGWFRIWLEDESWDREYSIEYKTSWTTEHHHNPDTTSVPSMVQAGRFE